MNARHIPRHTILPCAGLYAAVALLLGAGCGAPLAQATVAAQPREVTASPFETTLASGTASPAPTATPVPLASPTTVGATATYSPPASDRPAFKYVVVAGDTCIGIAQKFRTTTDKLLAANGFPDCTEIRVGMVLFIPRAVPYDMGASLKL
jgi:LysM repeat protein